MIPHVMVRSPSSTAVLDHATTRLPEALALLRRDGWTQGRFRNDCGERCITGALGEVDAPYDDWFVLCDVLMAGWEDTRVIVAFNDEPGRTFAEVERLMEKAILAATK